MASIAARGTQLARGFVRARERARVDGDGAAALQTRHTISALALRRLADDLLACCPYVGELTAQYKSRLASRGDAVSFWSMQYTKDLFSNIPISNIISEASFAASHVRRQSAHGNHPGPVTLAANHVLATAKTDLVLALREQGAGPVLRTPARDVRRRAGTPTCGSTGARPACKSWHCGGVLSQRSSGPSTHPLVCRTRSVALLEVDRLPSHGLGCGDGFYPTKATSLQEVARSVPTFSQSMQERIGHSAVPPAAAFEANTIHSCEKRYRQCTDNMEPGVRQNMDMFAKRLSRWSAVSKVGGDPFRWPLGCDLAPLLRRQ